MGKGEIETCWYLLWEIGLILVEVMRVMFTDGVHAALSNVCVTDFLG